MALSRFDFRVQIISRIALASGSNRGLSAQRLMNVDGAETIGKRANNPSSGLSATFSPYQGRRDLLRAQRTAIVLVRFRI